MSKDQLPATQEDLTAENLEALEAREELREDILIDQRTEIRELKKTVRGLEVALKEKDKKAPVNLEDAVFLMDGKKYQFTIPQFIFNGIKYTAFTAMEDVTILRHLVKIGFGGFKVIS